MKLSSLIYQILFFLVVNVFSSFQLTSNSNIEKLLEVNKTKESTELMVKQIIDIYQKQYPNVSFMTWREIESSINYKSYYSKIKQIYSSNYTDTEIKELIKLYNPKTMDKYTAKTKKIEQQLYNTGKEFGKELSQLITSKIR